MGEDRNVNVLVQDLYITHMGYENNLPIVLKYDLNSFNVIVILIAV